MQTKITSTTATSAAHRQGAFRSFCRDTRGLSTVEYLILLAVIVVGCVGIWNKIGGHVEKELNEAEKDIGTMGDEPDE